MSGQRCAFSSCAAPYPARPFCLSLWLIPCWVHQARAGTRQLCAQGRGHALGHGVTPVGPQQSCDVGSRSVHAHQDRQIVTATGQQGGKASDGSWVENPGVFICLSQ